MRVKITEMDGDQIDIDFGQTIGIPMMDDSMEMLIPRGAIMRLKPIAGMPENGSIVVFKKDDSIYVRRWYSEGDKIFLMPADSAYDPTIDQIEELHVLGEVKSYTANM